MPVPPMNKQSRFVWWQIKKLNNLYTHMKFPFINILTKQKQKQSKSNQSTIGIACTTLYISFCSGGIRTEKFETE